MKNISDLFIFCKSALLLIKPYWMRTQCPTIHGGSIFEVMCRVKTLVHFQNIDTDKSFLGIKLIIKDLGKK